jgi:hypothetical protein
MCVYLFSLSFLGNLAPCSAFYNLRGDEWRNCNRKIAYDIVEKILPVFYHYVVFMLQFIK